MIRSLFTEEQVDAGCTNDGSGKSEKPSDLLQGAERIELVPHFENVVDNRPAGTMRHFHVLLMFTVAVIVSI